MSLKAFQTLVEDGWYHRMLGTIHICKAFHVPDGFDFNLGYQWNHQIGQGFPKIILYVTCFRTKSDIHVWV